jgi:hypothetical protein
MTDLNRREFTGAVMLAALAPVLSGDEVAGVNLAGWWKPAALAADDLDALAKALADVVRTQYGNRLRANDLATVTSRIRTALERGAAMRKIELANGDEPDLMFAARIPGP